MERINTFFSYLLISLKLDVKRIMAYPASFWFVFLTIPFYSLVQIVFIETIYSQTSSFVGYSKYQAYVLFGTYRLVQGLGHLLFYGRLAEFKILLRGNGEETFDSALTKPIDAQLLTTLGKFSLGNISSILVGGFIIYYGLVKGTVTFTLLNFISYAILILLGTIIMYLTFLFLNTFLFWAEEFRVTESIWDTYQGFGQFPTNLYHGPIGLIFNIVIPITLMAGIPLDFLLGKESFIMIGVYIAILIALFFLTRMFWNVAIKRYASFSS